MKNKPASPRILLFDLECTQLAANMGHILCAGYRWLGEKKTHMLSIGDNPKFGKCPKATLNDRSVAERLSAVIAEADIIVHWFGEYFDEAFLNTRLLKYGLPPFSPVSRVDGWRIARKRLKFNSNRLDTVARFLKLPAQKNHIDWDDWELAGAGDRTALRKVEYHCELDIEVLEGAYLRLRPFWDQHPNMALYNKDGKPGCPKCGESGRMQRRGYQVKRTSLYVRYQCRACGGWSNAPTEKAVIR